MSDISSDANSKPRCCLVELSRTKRTKLSKTLEAMSSLMHMAHAENSPRCAPSPFYHTTWSTLPICIHPDEPHPGDTNLFHRPKVRSDPTTTQKLCPCRRGDELESLWDGPSGTGGTRKGGFRAARGGAVVALSTGGGFGIGGTALSEARPRTEQRPLREWLAPSRRETAPAIRAARSPVERDRHASGKLSVCFVARTVLVGAEDSTGPAAVRVCATRRGERSVRVWCQP